MTSVRNRLRSWTRVWLAWQLLALGGLLPVACCPTTEGARTAAECDPATICPMHANGAPGEECPMHRASAAPDLADCMMTGPCSGPAAALAALLGVPGIVPPAATLAVALPAVGISTFEPVTLDRLVPHDTPPPRL